MYFCGLKVLQTKIFVVLVLFSCRNFSMRRWSNNYCRICMCQREKKPVFFVQKRDFITILENYIWATRQHITIRITWWRHVLALWREGENFSFDSNEFCICDHICLLSSKLPQNAVGGEFVAWRKFEQALIDLSRQGRRLIYSLV